jgi:hypothetical protein
LASEHVSEPLTKSGDGSCIWRWVQANRGVKQALPAAFEASE